MVSFHFEIRLTFFAHKTNNERRKQMKKKLLFLELTLTLCINLIIPALAAETFTGDQFSFGE